jgi:hypothetical protein
VIEDSILVTVKFSFELGYLSSRQEFSSSCSSHLQDKKYLNFRSSYTMYNWHTSVDSIYKLLFFDCLRMPNHVCQPCRKTLGDLVCYLLIYGRYNHNSGVEPF